MDAMESTEYVFIGIKMVAPCNQSAQRQLTCWAVRGSICLGRFGNMTDFESARLFRAPLHACMRFVLCAGVNL